MNASSVLQVAPKLSGWLWSWGVPAALFLLALVATWLLYRKFMHRQP